MKNTVIKNTKILILMIMPYSCNIY